MYIVMIEFNRPSEDIPYYIDTKPELKAEFLGFLETNKQLIQEMQVINDGTKQTTVSIYADESMFNTFIELFNSVFPTLFVDRDAYCQANNITISRTIETM